MAQQGIGELGEEPSAEAKREAVIVVDSRRRLLEPGPPVRGRRRRAVSTQSAADGQLDGEAAEFLLGA